MKLKSDSIVLIIILAVALLFTGYLFAYETMKIILVPAIACGLILVLGAAQLFKELKTSAKTTPAKSEGSGNVDEKKRQKHIRYLIGLVWLIGYAIAIYLVGFIFGTFFFIVFVFHFNGKHSWTKSGLVAIAGAAAFWLSFVYWLQTDLFGGVLFNVFDLNWLTLT